MSQVFLGLDAYSIAGVDEEFIRFIFDVTLGSTTQEMNSEVGLILASNEIMQKLNRQYRGKDQPTNVLSFNNKEMISAQMEPDAEYLGDVYVGCDILAKEAQALHISEKERFAQLFVHGLLHLLDFDHATAPETAAMETLEDKIIQLVL